MIGQFRLLPTASRRTVLNCASLSTLVHSHGSLVSHVSSGVFFKYGHQLCIGMRLFCVPTEKGAEDFPKRPHTSRASYTHQEVPIKSGNIHEEVPT